MPTSPTPITTLPSAPATSTPSTFDSLADGLLAALPGFVSGANALGSTTYNNAVEAAASASTATTKSGEAASSASMATTQSGEAVIARNEAVSAKDAVIAAITAGPVLSVNGLTGVVTTPQSSGSGIQKGNGSGGFSAIVSGTDIKTINSTSLLGSGDITVGSSVYLTAKTGAYTLVAGDKGNVIDCASGTWTLGITAAATLGAGWYCYVRNIGAETITIDPSGSETIDGVTSGPLKSGMLLLIQCNGTLFSALRVGPQVAIEVLTSGTSWTCPLGVRSAKIQLAGGGGNSIPNGGGCAAGYVASVISTLPGTSYTYTIGSAGNPGGSTTWGTMTATGGPQGAGAGGSGSGGIVNTQGCSGSYNGNSATMGGGAHPMGYGSGGNASGRPAQSGAIILEY